MHDEHLSKASYRLDWQRVEDIIRQGFQPDEQSILFLLFGLGGQERLPLGKIAKLKKMKLKTLTPKVQALEKQLYKLLKVEDLDELIQEHLEQLSLTEEVAELQDSL